MQAEDDDDDDELRVDDFTGLMFTFTAISYAASGDAVRGSTASPSSLPSLPPSAHPSPERSSPHHLRSRRGFDC